MKVPFLLPVSHKLQNPLNTGTVKAEFQVEATCAYNVLWAGRDRVADQS